METVYLDERDMKYVKAFWEKLEKMKYVELDENKTTDVPHIRQAFAAVLDIPGATPRAREYFEQNYDKWAEGMAKQNREEAKKEGKKKGKNGPPASGVFHEGSKIKLNDGKIYLLKYRFYTDPKQPSIHIKLSFFPSDEKAHTYENSPYRWVQTIETNDYLDGNFYYLSPPGIMTKRLDIDTRIGGKQNSKYGGAYIDFWDMLGRLPKKEYDIKWKAELSLIKVDIVQNMKMIERLITFSWGFDIPIGSTGNMHELRIINNPTSFHLSKL